jgi:hypothetical protein
MLSLPVIYKTGLFTFYQLNKEFITENYCVNKDRPITMCYGKCFLERGMQLMEQTPSPKSINAQLKLEKTEFFVPDFVFSLLIPEGISVVFISPTPPVCDGVSTSLFRPPLV